MRLGSTRGCLGIAISSTPVTAASAHYLPVAEEGHVQNSMHSGHTQALHPQCGGDLQRLGVLYVSSVRQNVPTGRENRFQRFS